MSQSASQSVLAGVLAGAVAGALVGGVVARQVVPQTSQTPVVTTGGADVRDAMDQFIAVNERVLERLSAVESALTRISADSIAASDVAERDARLAEELGALRTQLTAELQRAEMRLSALESAIAGTLPGADGDGGELDDEEVRELTILTRDPSPGIRFSALSMLGRRRTDHGVQAACERLEDTEELVVWQALRNLGRFEESDVATLVVPLLSHDAAVIRAAAWEALRAMGAPDAGFHPGASEDERAEAVAAIGKWATENH